MIRLPAFGIPFLGCTSSRPLSSLQSLGPPRSSRCSPMPISICLFPFYFRQTQVTRSKLAGLKHLPHFGVCRRSFVNGSKGVIASYAESFQPRGFPPSPNDPSVNQPGFSRGQPSRVFIGHSIFKGKAALTFQPRGPEFSALDSGGIKLSKEGCMFFEFAPAVGVRQYDWSRKQVFALSVLEIGTLLSLGPNESCEFFHDPFMGKSEAGKIRKVLKVDPLPENSGYFFSLSVANRILNVDEHLNIPVTKAEFAVMQSAFNFILPHLMGWHLFVDSTKPDELVHVVSGNSGSQERSSFEWDAPF